jgi:hypothetical protein
MIAPEQNAFICSDGTKLTSLFELATFLRTCSDATYAHHVSAYDNHFATWVMDVFKLPLLASQIRGAKSKLDLVAVLDRYVQSKTPALAKRAPEKGIERETQAAPQSSFSQTMPLQKYVQSYSQSLEPTHHEIQATKPLSPSKQTEDLFFEAMNPDHHLSHAHSQTHPSLNSQQQTHNSHVNSINSQDNNSHQIRPSFTSAVKDIREISHDDDLHLRIQKLHAEMEELRAFHTAKPLTSALQNTKQNQQTQSSQQAQKQQSSQPHQSYQPNQPHSFSQNTNQAEQAKTAPASHSLKEKLTYLAIGTLVGVVIGILLIKLGGFF